LSITNECQNYISNLLQLNLNIHPHLDTRGAFINAIAPNNIPTHIPIVQHHRNAEKTMKCHLLMVATELGYKKLDKKMKMKLVQAILQTEAYYKGFLKPIALDYTFYHW
jgi:hypothetical protein